MSGALVAIVATWTLAGIFLLAAAHKTRHYLAFRGILAEYRLLPDSLVPVAAPLVIGIEAIAGLAVLTPAAIIPTRVAVLPVGALLCLYTYAIAINLVRGRTNIDCGCGGESIPLSNWLLVRNGLMLGLAAVVAGTPAKPASPAIYALATAPVLFLWCAYAIGNQMLTNAGHMRPDGR